MSSYYYPTHHRQQSYSQSYYPTQGTQLAYPPGYSSHHSSPHRHIGYTQPGTYYPSPQYVAPTYHYDSGRHHHHHGHARTGSGGMVYYKSSAPSHSHHHSTSRRSPTHRATVHTTARRSTSSHAHTHPLRSSRSQSVPRQTVRVAADSGQRLRRSESRPRETVTSNVSHHRRGSSSGEPLTDRIRRMFGFGSGSPHRDHRADYANTRSGRTVDWRGRPIYRV